MTDNEIKEEQFDFYKKHKAGCSFAAIVARQPDNYGWHQEVLRNLDFFDKVVETSIKNNDVSTLSLILPNIQTITELCNLIRELEKQSSVIIEQVSFEDFQCIGMRVKIDIFTSWVSGFGNFNFFPLTRQAPFTELSFRVKPRPDYEWIMKEAPENVIHLADLDMHGITKDSFVRLWNSSLLNTEKILGHKPDLKSAAKTTFAIPTKYL